MSRWRILMWWELGYTVGDYPTITGNTGKKLVTATLGAILTVFKTCRIESFLL